ncbi:hypothetical protein DWX93_09810 [Roseburia hominis]|uniref:Uncharacterized protein n=1 Tax=Roseburia hominis TaxID=301301 RepID=A0A395VB16_9FIRM|nr:hypothetical protein DWX93_09810 [Roseburia hominis]
MKTPPDKTNVRLKNSTYVRQKQDKIEYLFEKDYGSLGQWVYDIMYAKAKVNMEQRRTPCLHVADGYDPCERARESGKPEVFRTFAGAGIGDFRRMIGRMPVSPGNL